MCNGICDSFEKSQEAKDKVLCFSIYPKLNMDTLVQGEKFCDLVQRVISIVRG